MRKVSNDEFVKAVYKKAKRIAITVLICIPFLFVLAYLTRRVITQNWMQILMFVSILLVVVIVEELIYSSRQKRKQDVETKDVFK